MFSELHQLHSRISKLVECFVLMVTQSYYRLLKKSFAFILDVLTSLRCTGVNFSLTLNGGRGGNMQRLCKRPV